MAKKGARGGKGKSKAVAGKAAADGVQTGKMGKGKGKRGAGLRGSGGTGGKAEMARDVRQISLSCSLPSPPTLPLWCVRVPNSWRCGGDCRGHSHPTIPIPIALGPAPSWCTVGLVLVLMPPSHRHDPTLWVELELTDPPPHHPSSD
jgi:hypothetical protein